MDFLILADESVVLCDTAECEFFHKVDFIG